MAFHKFVALVFVVLMQLVEVFAQYEYLYHGLAHTRDASLTGDLYWGSEDGGWQAYTYKAIKYANAKRFEPSTMNIDFSYKRNSSYPRNGPTCPQLPDEYPSGDIPMSEDCLYLDIHVPAVFRQHSRLGWSKFPVLFYVHGGEFKSGHKDVFQGGELAMSTGAVVVVANFRIGVFGFLSTEDSNAPGNWALYDLRLALKWVHSNIQSFGGDNTKITLAGERAGGVLVSILAMNEGSRELIHGAITLSGNVFSPWGIKKEPEQVARALATRLDCPNDTVAMMRCFRKANTSELLHAAAFVERSSGISLAPLWAPVIDGIQVQYSPSWLTEGPAWTFKGGYVTGYSTNDAAWPLLMRVPRIFGHNTVDHDWILNTFVPSLLDAISECSTKTYPISTATAKDLYMRYGFATVADPKELHRRVVQMTTDAFYAAPAMKESFLYAKKSIAKTGNQMYVVSAEDNYDTQSVSPIPDVLHLFGHLNTSSVSTAHVNVDVTRELRRLVGHVIRHGYGFGRQFDAVSGHRLVLGVGHEWRTANGINVQEFVGFWDRLAQAGCG